MVIGTVENGLEMEKTEMNEKSGAGLERERREERVWSNKKVIRLWVGGVREGDCVGM